MERLRPRTDDEQGFTLIELLVVVIIIGVLAAIAIPVYLNQRKTARDAAVKSDLRNAATAQVAYQIQFEEYTGDVATLANEVKFGPSDGVEFDRIRFRTDQRFCMVAHHEANEPGQIHWFFDSNDPHPQKAADASECDGRDSWSN